MNRRAFFQIPIQGASPPDLTPVEGPFTTASVAGFPRDYARHCLVLIEDVRAWLTRDETGFYAIDAACPHMGGLLRPVEDGFFCHCHRSRFSSTGDVLSDQTRDRLRYFRVDVDSDGRLVIQRDQTVSPDDRFIP